MGGIVGDIGKLFGGSSAKTDRRETLGSYGELNNLYNYGINAGKSALSQGQDLLGRAGQYYTRLLSGNRPAALQAISPVTAAANAQADAQKRQIATGGTARGGGVNAATQQIDTSRQAAVDQALNSAVSGAAGGAAGVGSTESGIGGNLLGVAQGSAADTLRGSIESRPVSFGIHNATADTAGNLTQGLLTDIFNPSAAIANIKATGG